MASLHTCTSCRGFLPAASTACPNCGTAVAARRTLGRSLLAVAGAGVAAVTLMACYGAPETMPRLCEDDSYDCYEVQEDGGDTSEQDGGELDASVP